jgi:hypothetical protein
MKEMFLHYVWENGLFEHQQLMADNHAEVQIVNRGSHNSDSGPDFFNAQIRLGNQLFVGNVEIHVKSSDWNRHRHQHDPAYNNTILHVVHENDIAVLDGNGRTLPCIELKHRIPSGMYQNYIEFSQHLGLFPCEFHRPSIFQNSVIKMKHRALVDRLELKSEIIHQMLTQTIGDWDEVFYRFLCRYMGFKVNAAPMEQLAEKTPLKLLLKNRHRPLSIEALLFGQAGMLEPNWSDPYVQVLKTEYSFLQKKYQLEPLHAGIWKMHRMRPQNFPGTRLAQLASIMIQSPLSLAEVASKESLMEVYDFFDVEPNPFWQTHYHFAKQTAWHSGKMGAQAIDNMIINVLVPFLYAYGKASNKVEWVDKVLQWLHELAAEENQVTRKWRTLDMPIESAYDSQAFLGLNGLYCEKKRCLECDIGVRIISK